MTKQLRILYIISGDLFAGKEVQLLNLISELDQKDVSTAVIIFNQALLFKKLQATKTKIYLIDEKKGLLNLIFHIRKYLKEFKPDLLVAENYKEAILAFFASVFTKIKFIVHFHGALENSKGLANIKISLYYFIYQLIAKHFADLLIFPTKDLADKFAENSKKAKIIRNSFKFTLQPQAVSLEKPAILCIGRLAKVKSFDRAIKAFVLFLDTYYNNAVYKPKLYILGEGEERLFLEELISELNLQEHVELLGFKENAQDYLQAADLLLISSSHEGIPTVLLETISQNKPLVSTAVGGIPEVLSYFKDYNYQLVNPESLVEMATAINTVLAKKATGVLSEKNLQILKENFSAEMVAAEHLSIYKNLMS